MELISIIVPVYNVEKYIKRCVESIQKQTYTNIEIILVEDGSLDNCPQICDQLATEDSRIKVIHKENGGQGLARNAGLEIAGGEYVAFVDSDDWISETHIANLYAAIKENHADMVIGAHSTATDPENSVPRPIRLEEKVYEGQYVINDILLPLIGPNVDFPQDVQIESACWGKLYRRKNIVSKQITFPSERVAVGEDLFFNAWCVYYSQRVVVINEIGYHYFENRMSTTRKYNSKRYDRTVNFYTDICKLVQACELEDIIAHRAERTLLLKMRTAVRLVVVSDMTRKQKFQEIKRYLENETLTTVLENYPIETLIPAISFLYKRMLAKNVAGVYYLMRVREAAKHLKLLKKTLKLIGIGKE